MDKRIEALRNATGIQCTDGNWNYGPYMHGMANGLILALSIMEDRPPEFLTAPKRWMSEFVSAKKKQSDLERLKSKILTWQQKLEELTEDKEIKEGSSEDSEPNH